MSRPSGPSWSRCLGGGGRGSWIAARRVTCRRPTGNICPYPSKAEAGHRGGCWRKPSCEEEEEDDNNSESSQTRVTNLDGSDRRSSRERSPSGPGDVSSAAMFRAGKSARGRRSYHELSREGDNGAGVGGSFRKASTYEGDVNTGSGGETEVWF